MAHLCSTDRCNKIILLISICLTSIEALSSSERSTNDIIGLGTSDIIRLRGYLAEDHFVEVTGGYILNLVRARNPLINSTSEHCRTILMVHGILTNANCFIFNSVGARPKDFTNIDFKSKSIEELNRMFSSEPSANSLVFLALNLGCDVWLVNRRGSTQSLGQAYPDKQAMKHPLQNFTSFISSYLPSFLTSIKERQTNLESVGISDIIETIFDFRGYPSSLIELDNPKYWDYSLDEQALYDIPEVVDYVLKESGRQRLSLVGHSAGSALILMSLAARPELADKLDRAQLWAPALDLGDTKRNNPIIATLYPLLPLGRMYIGSIPPVNLSKLLQRLLGILCEPAITRDTLCAGAADLGAGFGGLQQKIVSIQISYV